MSKKYNPKEFETTVVDLTGWKFFGILLVAVAIVVALFYFTWNYVLVNGVAFIYPITLLQATLLTVAWVLLRRWRLD